MLNIDQRTALADHCYREWLQHSVTRDANGQPRLPNVEARAAALVAIRQDLKVQPVVPARQGRLF